LQESCAEIELFKQRLEEALVELELMKRSDVQPRHVTDNSSSSVTALISEMNPNCSLSIAESVLPPGLCFGFTYG